MITVEDLALMKTAATLINTSRSGIIAPGALEAALKAGMPGFAVIDVDDVEPVLDCGMETLLQLPNVLATPHLGYMTVWSMHSWKKNVIQLVSASGRQFVRSTKDSHVLFSHC